MKLIEEIRAYCSENADPKAAAKYQRYFKEGYDAWGLLDSQHPFWNEKQTQWLENNRRLGLKGFLKLGEELMRSGKYEEASIAIRFVKSFLAEMTAQHLPALERWFAAGIRDWAHTDVLCGELLSPMLVDGRIQPESLAGWRSAAPRFQRRAVPVALIPLLKTAKPAPLIKFISPMMLDQERIVHQGLGWFLRECWKKDAAATEKFLFDWKDRAARLIFQYATEKMAKEARARFKKKRPG